MDLNHSKTSKGLPIIKFQSEERIRSIQNGKLYLKNLAWFRELEKQTGDMTVGDIREGMLHVANGYVELTCLNNNTTSIYALDDTLFETLFSNAFVFCATDTSPDANGYAFNNDNKAELVKFGNTALVINNVFEFIRRIVEKASDLGYKTFYGTVRYYNSNEDSADVFIDLLRGLQNIAFWKRDSYCSQKEFRIVVWNKEATEDHLELDIGDISCISNVFTTNEALNIQLKKQTQ